MKLIRTIVRPEKLDAVKDALESLSVRSITVTDVRYRGPEKRHIMVFRGIEIVADFSDKQEIEMIVHDDDVDEVVDTIIRSARTGSIGDGHVSVIPISHRYSIHDGMRDIC
jgi:nitrogen regulatory protein P-II 1